MHNRRWVAGGEIGGKAQTGGRTMPSILDRVPEIIDFDIEDWQTKEREFHQRFSEAGKRMHQVDIHAPGGRQEANRLIDIANAIGRKGNAHNELMHAFGRNLAAWHQVISILQFDKEPVSRAELYALLELAPRLSALRNPSLSAAGSELAEAAIYQLRRLDRQAKSHPFVSVESDEWITCPGCQGVGASSGGAGPRYGGYVVCPMCAGRKQIRKSERRW